MQQNLPFYLSFASWFAHLITPHSHFYSVIHAATPFIMMRKKVDVVVYNSSSSSTRMYIQRVKYLWLFTIIIFHLTLSPFIPNWLDGWRWNGLREGMNEMGGGWWRRRGGREMEIYNSVSERKYFESEDFSFPSSSFFIYRNINTYRVWYYSYYLLLIHSRLSFTHSRCVLCAIINNCIVKKEKNTERESEKFVCTENVCCHHKHIPIYITTQNFKYEALSVEWCYPIIWL